MSVHCVCGPCFGTTSIRTTFCFSRNASLGSGNSRNSSAFIYRSPLLKYLDTDDCGAATPTLTQIDTHDVRAANLLHSHDPSRWENP